METKNAIFFKAYINVKKGSIKSKKIPQLNGGVGRFTQLLKNEYLKDIETAFENKNNTVSSLL